MGEGGTGNTGRGEERGPQPRPCRPGRWLRARPAPRWCPWSGGGRRMGKPTSGIPLAVRPGMCLMGVRGGAISHPCPTNFCAQLGASQGEGGGGGGPINSSLTPPPTAPPPLRTPPLPQDPQRPQSQRLTLLCYRPPPATGTQVAGRQPSILSVSASRKEGGKQVLGHGVGWDSGRHEAKQVFISEGHNILAEA